MEEYSLDCDEIYKITLISNDGEEYEIEQKKCSISEYIDTMVTLDTQVKTIPINVSGKLLELIVKFMKFYSERDDHNFHRIQKPVPKNFHECKFIHDDRENVFDIPFYTELMDNFDSSSLIELIRIVNYLSISPLLELICAKVANIIRDKTEEEQKRFLEINDSDYVEMKKANNWVNK